ncbi:MAG: hypothetical protein HYV34_03155 [Candidatus Kerfeldbacteria bacterium]|nr:hypothetical protein [Candidatus Kerfeldbacteria bacterium]
MPPHPQLSWIPHSIAAASTPLLALSIFVIIQLSSLLSPTMRPTSDAFTTRLLPVSLIRDGDFYLDEFSTHDPVKDTYLFWRSRDGHLVSGYPIGTAIVATPFYAIPVLTGWIDESDHLWSLSRFIALIFTSVFTVMIFFLARRWLPELPSAGLALLSFFGTNMWSIASQDLWQHGLVSVFLLYALLLFSSPTRGTPRSLFLLGLALGGSVLTRYSTVVFLLPFFVVAVWRYQWKVMWVVFGAVFPAAIFIAYAHAIFGWPAEHGLLYGYDLWVGPSLGRVLGIWISPSRGLLWFSPFFFFSLVGFWVAWKKTRDGVLRDSVFVSVAVLLLSTLLYGSWYSWEGAGSFGPRMTIETIPFLMLGLILGIRYGLLRSPSHRILFILLAGLSVTTHLIGATQFDYEWQSLVGSRDVEPWLFRDGQLWFFYSRVL